MTRTSNLKIWMGILALTTVIQTQKCEGFEEYVVKYNKKYKDIEEYEYREKVYCENVKKIEEINAQNLSYKLGINKFTDITDEEMSSKLCLLWREKRIPGKCIHLNKTTVQLEAN